MSRFEPFFLDSPSGRLFALHRAPADSVEIVVVVPPFAEEMNKCRRQVSLTSARLAQKGIATLVVDLIGTGDSAGDFEDATWDIWVDNVVSCLEWAARSGYLRTCILGIRLGAMLGAAAVTRAGAVCDKTLLLQPLTDGGQFMNQFIRLRVAAAMMGPGSGETAQDIVARLERGKSQEIAGYSLSRALWTDIAAMRLEDSLSAAMGDVAMVEVRRGAEGKLSPRGRKLMEAAKGRGVTIDGHCVSGEPFWSSTEIVTNSAAADVTAGFFAGEQ